jgi:curved DNA-binding protein
VADPYRTLGVSRAASAEDIKRAFRKLARELHPDVTGNDEQLTKRFQQVLAAYEVLSDPARKRNYDLYGGADDSPSPYAKLDLDALLDQLWPSRKKKPKPEAGIDDERRVHITMAESLLGVNKTVGKLAVKIPPGIADGARLRLKGQGQAGLDGGPAGDLFVRIDVVPDPRMWRVDNDLHVNVRCELSLLVLGGTLQVDLPHGALKVPVAAGTQGGHALRVKGRGFAHKQQVGDVVLELQVKTPQVSSSNVEQARALLEQLEALAVRPRA